MYKHNIYMSYISQTYISSVLKFLQNLDEAGYRVVIIPRVLSGAILTG